MSGKTYRSARAPVAGVPNPLEIDHTSGHKKSKRNQPRLDRSSDSQIEKQIPSSSSPIHRGDNVSRTSSSDDDADGDVSNADAGEPDEESDEDGNGDAFAPSGRAIEEHGDQTGHINEDDTDRSLVFEGKQRNISTPIKGHVDVTERSVALCDSDDDFYDGVDLISNSEEDEPHIEQLEEANILESEEANDLNIPPAYLEASDGWDGFEIEDGLFLEDVPFFDEQYGRSDSHILDAEIELFRSASILDGFPSPQQPSPSPRRVRFKDPISELSNDSDMDSDDGGINMLFATPIVPSSGNMGLSGPSLGYEDDGGSSVGSSSGYETDYGDTTDEEDVPASATKRPQSLLRRPSLSSIEFEALVPAIPKAKNPFQSPGPSTEFRRGPRMGTWIVDSTKPCAVIDSTGETMIIRPATCPSKPNNVSATIANGTNSNANASPLCPQPKLVAAREDGGVEHSGFSSQLSRYEYNDPVLGPGSDMVATAASVPSGHSRQPSMDDPFAAPSVFLPMDAMGNVSSLFENEGLNDEDEEDDDALLNIDDFIDFGDDSSEGGDQTAGDDSTSTSPVTAEDSRPVQLKTPSPDALMTSADLMKHLDSHMVSAFRRGQPHHQPQSRSRHGNPLLNNYALKAGKQAAASAPMGTQKKRKMSGNFGHRPPFGVPAAKRRIIHHR